MDFIGSKERFSDWIAEKIGNVENSFVVDGCAGSGVMSRKFANMGARVLSVDLLTFPCVIVKGSTTTISVIAAERHISKINSLDGIDGFFYENYCPNGNRFYFTDDNARRIDSCRQYIDGIKSEDMKNYLLYCALEGLSRVQNTSGHQVSFLKNFKSRSLNRFELRFEPLCSGTVQAVQGNLLNIFKNFPFKNKCQAVYMDLNPRISSI